MQQLRTSKLFLFILMALLMVAPVAAVYAEDGDDDHSAETDGHAEGDDDGHSAEVTTVSMSSDGNIATGVTLGLLGLIILLVGVVSVIGAVALGLIGIGYTQVSGDDD